jgi:hypothetical protein
MDGVFVPAWVVERFLLRRQVGSLRPDPLVAERVETYWFHALPPMMLMVSSVWSLPTAMRRG